MGCLYSSLPGECEHQGSSKFVPVECYNAIPPKMTKVGAGLAYNDAVS